MSVKGDTVDAFISKKLAPMGQILYRQFYGFEAEAYVAIKRENVVSCVVILVQKLDKDNFKILSKSEASATTFNANEKLLKMLTPPMNVKSLNWRKRCAEVIAERKAARDKSKMLKSKTTQGSTLPKTRKTQSKCAPPVDSDYERVCKLFKVAWADVRDTLPQFDERRVSRELQFLNTVSVLGRCSTFKDHCTILFSKKYLKLDDQEILNVLAHELIHAIRGCHGHQGLWKQLADEFTRKTRYTIKRLAPKGVDRVLDGPRLACECGCSFSVSARSNHYKTPEKYRCKAHRMPLFREDSKKA